MKKKILLGLALAGLILAPTLAKASGIDDGSNLQGIGTVKDAWSRGLYPGVTYSRIDSSNSAGNQISHLVDFNSNELDLKPVVTFGDKVYGLNKMASLVEDYENRGYKVAYAINADSFFWTGNPKGTMIKDGIIHATGDSYRTSLGFTEDGRTVYGNPGVGVRVNIEGENFIISKVNAERGDNKDSAYLLTESFDSKTRSTEAGYEVVIDVDDASYNGLKINSVLEGRVNRVYKVSAQENAPIGKGQLVLTCSDKSAHAKKLAKTQPGDKVRVIVVGSKNWESVRDAFGVFRPIKEFGKYTERAQATDIQPRTTIALKSDGTFRIMENDGRLQSARGLSYKDLVNFLSIGDYETILALDGGGSSTIYTTMPGYSKAVRLNTPSDGGERSISNALLFVTEKREGSSIDRLHIYPRGAFKSELTLDIGESVEMDTKATDNRFDPVPIDLNQVSYISSLGFGSGASFTAGAQVGEELLKATYPNGAEGSIRLKTVNRLDSLIYKPGSVRLRPNQEISLDILGKAGNKEYKIRPSLIVAENDRPDLASLSESGLLTAGEIEGSGNLTLSFGGKDLTIPYTVRDQRKVERIAGDNRYKTSQLISQKFGQADTVLLANSGNFPDALVAASLATEEGAPILLSDASRLGEETKEAMASLGAKRVIILGGENSISSQVQNELTELGYRVERLAGSNRYQTALSIARSVENKSFIYLASGENYPDALALNSLSSKDRTPILLTGKDSLASEVEEYIREKNISKVIIAGGQATVSGQVEGQLKDLGIEVERIAGSNRFETSSLIASRAYPKENGYIIASGEGFIDALTAGPLASLGQRSILLTSKGQMDPAVKSLIANSPADRLTIIGGENTIDENLKTAIEEIVD